MNWRGNRLCIAALGLSAVYFPIGIVLPKARPPGSVRGSSDIYSYFYPNIVYAWDSIREGAGILWNPYQNCGQPFYANASTGLLYPLNLVFWVLDREAALLLNMVCHLGIIGVGGFFLFREFRLSRIAALCGAFALQLSGSTLRLATWSPIHIDGYAWLPVAMLVTERLLRAPSIRLGLVLGTVLTVQLLPGFPQTAVFTYQLISLRVLWALLTRQVRRPVATLGGVGAGFALPLLLGAVQFLPYLELMQQSLRTTRLSGREMLPGVETQLELEHFRASLGDHTFPGNTLPLIALALAALAFWRRDSRIPAGFYLLVAVGYFSLSFGPGTPLFDLYASLPLGSAFRGPSRFLWMTSLGLAALAAFGAEAILALPPKRPASGVAQLSMILATVWLFNWLATTGLDRNHWLLTAAPILAPAIVMFRPRWTWLPALALPVAVGLNCLLIVSKPRLSNPRGDLYSANSEALERVAEMLTPQDRVLVINRGWDRALTPKIASIFRIPNIHDYAPLVSRTYAEYFVRLRMNRPLRSINDWYMHTASINTPPWVRSVLGMPIHFNRRLLDLTAARYLIVDRRYDEDPRTLPPGLELRFRDQRLSVYENLQAFPRAFFVPRISIKSEDQVLPILASGAVDPRRVALVSQPLESGFRGTSPPGAGSVEFVVNEPERVVIRTQADQAGFLFLADQFSPSWTARVDGQPAAILRANHAFRLVPVPAGTSEVTFRYRPTSLYFGACISFATCAALVIVWAGGRREQHRTSGDIAG